jgi:aminoglycoside phosphotransferase (APT) family kinase protein
VASEKGSDQAINDLERLVPEEGLRRFLDERFGPSPSAPEVSRLGEGHSNLTFLITRGDDRWVLRRPPRGEILPGTHEMHREYAVMRAIAENGMKVPVPSPIELCRDEGYLGAPFYLMSYVDGIVIRGPIPDVFDEPSSRRGIGYELVDRLSDIHTLDWEVIGLAELARKPQEFLSRNLRRMQELYDAVRHREVREVDEAGEWLRANAPAQTYVTLTHGDYKLDNVMLAPEPPPRIAAVVDWEIATIGDPLVDLGWLLYFSPEAGDPTYESVAGDATREPGFPTRAELAERYTQRTGRSIDDLRFYCAMAGWKIAIIMEGSNLRFKQGMSDDSLFAALDAAVPALAQHALDIISGATPVGV